MQMMGIFEPRIRPIISCRREEFRGRYQQHMAEEPVTTDYQTEFLFCVTPSFSLPLCWFWLFCLEWVIILRLTICIKVTHPKCTCCKEKVTLKKYGDYSCGYLCKWTQNNSDDCNLWIRLFFLNVHIPVVKVSLIHMPSNLFTWIPPRSSLPAMPSTSSMIRTCSLLTVWDVPTKHTCWELHIAHSTHYITGTRWCCAGQTTNGFLCNVSIRSDQALNNYM